MLKIYETILVFLTAIGLLSCSDERPAADVIRQAESLIHVNADSALTLIDGLNLPDMSNDSLRAKAYMVQALTHWEAEKAMDSDTVLTFAIDYYKTTAPNREKLSKAETLYAVALSWVNQGDRCDSIIARNITSAFAHRDTALAEWILEVQLYLAQETSNQRKIISATRALLSLSHDDESGPIEYRDLLGTAYYLTGQPDSAMTIYDGIFRQADSGRLSPSDSVAAYGYALLDGYDIAAQCGRRDFAISGLKALVLRCNSHKNYDNASLGYASIARQYLNMGIRDSARHYIDLALNTASPALLKNNIPVRNYYEVLRLLIDYSYTNRVSPADMERLSINRSINGLYRLSKRYDSERHGAMLLKERNLQLIITRQQQQIWLGSISFILILAIAIVVFSIKRRNRKLAERQDEIETLQKMLAESHNASNRDENFVKKAMLQQIGVIRLVAENPSTANQELLQRMMGIADQKVKVEALLDWEYIYKIIDYLYDNFHSRLIERYGDMLNEKEIQLCCLLKAKFSTKEISIVTQQSLQTVYQRKSMLRRKLSMPEAQDITSFLS